MAGLGSTQGVMESVWAYKYGTLNNVNVRVSKKRMGRYYQSQRENGIDIPTSEDYKGIKGGSLSMKFGTYTLCILFFPF